MLTPLPQQFPLFGPQQQITWGHDRGGEQGEHGRQGGTTQDFAGKHICPGFPQPPRHPPPQHPPPPQLWDSTVHGWRHLKIGFLQIGRSSDDEQQQRLSITGWTLDEQVVQDVTAVRHCSDGSPET